MYARRLLPLVALVAVAPLVGCRGKKDSDFVPPSQNARKAVEAALDSWKAGQPPGVLAGTSKPAVEAVDFEWSAGQKLAGYEILAEEAGSGAEPRTFTVRLTPPGGAPREVKYKVFGIDPLSVYRDKDYDKLSGAGS